MNRKRVVRGMLLIVLAGGMSVPALAILGIGDVVFDPTNFQQAIQRLIQLQQQYAQLVRTYQKISAQYEQMLWMAKTLPVNMAARYRAPLSPSTNSTATR